MVNPFFLHTIKLGDNMKKKVGILLRKDETYHLNKELVEWVEECEMLPIGIICDNLEDMICITEICDGIILQGGSNYTEEELEFVRYLYRENIPTLGICLGMQMMAISMDGILAHLKNELHQNNQTLSHNIEIMKNTKLYDIVKTDKISVNSRHKDYVKWTELTISAFSDDGVIEAIEDKNHKYFIGVQWHPESIKDVYSNNLLKSFKDNL